VNMAARRPHKLDDEEEAQQELVKDVVEAKAVGA